MLYHNRFYDTQKTYLCCIIIRFLWFFHGYRSSCLGCSNTDFFQHFPESRKSKNKKFIYWNDPVLENDMQTPTTLSPPPKCDQKYWPKRWGGVGVGGLWGCRPVIKIKKLHAVLNILREKKFLRIFWNICEKKSNKFGTKKMCQYFFFQKNIVSQINLRQKLFWMKIIRKLFFPHVTEHCAEHFKI